MIMPALYLSRDALVRLRRPYPAGVRGLRPKYPNIGTIMEAVWEQLAERLENGWPRRGE